MKHHFLDHYWQIKSPVHALDPRLKVVSFCTALLAVVVTPNSRLIEHFFFAPLLLTMLVLARIPVRAVLKRMLVVVPLVIIIGLSLPFIGKGEPIFSFQLIFKFTVTADGLVNFFSVIIKAMEAVWIMTLLTATTSFRDLVAAMQELHFPTLFTSILGFMYRYIFLFIDEAERLNMGRLSRSFGKRPLLAIKGFGWMILSLFLRSFERSERMYQAMAARGFTGRFETLTVMKISEDQTILAVAFLIIVLLIKLMGYFYG